MAKNAACWYCGDSIDATKSITVQNREKSTKQGGQGIRVITRFFCNYVCLYKNVRMEMKSDAK